MIAFQINKKIETLYIILKLLKIYSKKTMNNIKNFNFK